MVGRALFFHPAHPLFFSITDMTQLLQPLKHHCIKMAKIRTCCVVLWKEDYNNQSYSLLKDMLFYFFTFWCVWHSCMLLIEVMPRNDVL